METENNRPKEKVRTSKIIVSVIAVLFLIWGIWMIVSMFNEHRSTVTTDDAQVEQYISPINVKVSGYIKEIRFTEHEFVHKGDTL